jgi:hypothetical protein
MTDEEAKNEDGGEASLFDVKGTPKFSPIQAQQVALWCMLGMAVAHQYKIGRQPAEIHRMVDDIVESGMPPETVPGWMFVLALAVDQLRRLFGFEPKEIHQVVDANLLQVQQMVAMVQARAEDEAQR